MNMLSSYKKKNKACTKKNKLTQTTTATPLKGRAIVVHGEHVSVEDSRQIIYRCSFKKRIGTVVCGDHVLWNEAPHKTGVVTKILPRHSLLARPDIRGKLKPIAANLDQLIIVVAPRISHAKNDLNTQLTSHCELPETELIDRYIAAAETASMTPVIVFNKIDLLDEQQHEEALIKYKIYEQIGYQTQMTSMQKNIGLQQLGDLLTHRTSAFVGQSGVGKSSLINCYLPHANVTTGTVSVLSGLGRHTTTTTILYHLPEGGQLVDSPGVREFGLGEIDKASFDSQFIEFRPYLGLCKFNNCRHLSEPKCAVIDAVQQGEIDSNRFNNYQKLLNL
ncbi:Ribosome small subunit biogenesis RbfA-release protein RsgA [hydrothermal vent metagenome]|uniref:Ribosome small subunit biogenesis RbfA-release protein RsgA n=1 Tax=hydrothermal vent metagenome TaxID=652676 RepID=A0A3B0Z811_9ZZZZ